MNKISVCHIFGTMNGADGCNCKSNYVYYREKQHQNDNHFNVSQVVGTLHVGFPLFDWMKQGTFCYTGFWCTT